MNLQSAIDALADDSVPLDGALRQVLVIAKRVRSTEIQEWVRHELNGFEADDEVPSYRKLNASSAQVRITFSLPNETHSQRIGLFDLPEPLRIPEGTLAITQPVSSIARLAVIDGDRSPAIPLPASWVYSYNQLGAEAPLSMPPFQVIKADIVLDVTHLGDMVSRVRTFATDLVLDIEDVAPEAGAHGGPTVDDSKELQSVTNIYIDSLSGGSMVLGGNVGKVHANTVYGDYATILDGAGEYLAEQGVAQLKEAIETDGGKKGPAVMEFLRQVRAGVITRATGIGTDAAYQGVMALIDNLPAG